MQSRGGRWPDGPYPHFLPPRAGAARRHGTELECHALHATRVTRAFQPLRGAEEREGGYDAPPFYPLADWKFDGCPASGAVQNCSAGGEVKGCRARQLGGGGSPRAPPARAQSQRGRCCSRCSLSLSDRGLAWGRGGGRWGRHVACTPGRERGGCSLRAGARGRKGRVGALARSVADGATAVGKGRARAGPAG